MFSACGAGMLGHALQALGHRLALQVLHHEVELAVGRRAEVADVDDVLVTDLVDRLRLDHEARHHLGVARQLGVDGLHGHLLADHRVLGEKHHTHPALSELGGDLVVPYGLSDVNH